MEIGGIYIGKNGRLYVNQNLRVVGVFENWANLMKLCWQSRCGPCP